MKDVGHLIVKVIKAEGLHINLLFFFEFISSAVPLGVNGDGDPFISVGTFLSPIIEIGWIGRASPMPQFHQDIFLKLLSYRFHQSEHSSTFLFSLSFSLLLIFSQRNSGVELSPSSVPAAVIISHMWGVALISVLIGL